MNVIIAIWILLGNKTVYVASLLILLPEILGYYLLISSARKGKKHATV